MSAAAAAVEVDQPLSNNPATLARNALRVKSALLTKKPESKSVSKSVSIAPTSSNPDPASSQLNESDNSDSDRSVELQPGQFEVSKFRPGTDELLDPAPATHRDLTMTRSQAPSQARNTNTRNALISETGREFGPDIALKVGPNIDNAEFKLIINENSSITEVLNILAFLLNNDGEQRKGSVIDKFSYNDNESFDKVYNSLKDSAPFNITTLTTTLGVSEGDEITIPGTILRRDKRYDLKTGIKIQSKQIQPLISACILQMINILENTREVFGGWAKLFKGMQGGSSKSKTKKTRRRY